MSLKKKPTSISRRAFFEKSAKICAGISFPFIIPASALGRSGAVAPSERITLGHIGCGKIGLSLRNGFTSQPDTQIVAICDTESTRLVEYKAWYEKTQGERLSKDYAKGVDVYKNYKELLARKDIDAVIISTPDHWHANLTIEACRAGKDMYCEKPLTHTVGEAYEVVDAVKQYGRILQNGSMQRSGQEFRFAVEMVRNGRIGKVHTVNCDVGLAPNFFYDLPQEQQTTFEWNEWVGPANYHPYNSKIAPLDPDKNGWAGWRQYNDYGGGGQCDWGAHMYDIAQWGLGRDGDAPIEVIPEGQQDRKCLTYLYNDGVVMQRKASTLFPGMTGGVEFIGDKGSLYVGRGQLETKPANLKEEATRADEQSVYTSINHQRNFIDCVKTREKAICDEIVGASTAIVCNLGNIADRIGQSFKWDHKKGLTDNETANRYLNPPKRAGFAS